MEGEPQCASAAEARRLFMTGLNCCQSVLCAHAESLGLDADLAKRIAAPFGGGIGRMRGVCGAFSACAMIVGLKCGDKPKGDVYALVQSVAREFSSQNGGSIICGELLGLGDGLSASPKPSERTEQYYKKRPCADIVERASAIADKFLRSRESEA